MAKAQAYFSQSVGNLNNPYATIAQLIAQLGGYANPAKDEYVAPERIDAVDPTLRTLESYLAEVGAKGYQYSYDDILNLLNASTEAAQVSQQEKLRQADTAYKQAVAENQDSAFDTIRQQYAQGIQNGINKGMAAANQLSTILATSKESAKTAQENAEARVNAANEYYADLAKNGVTALDKSNAAMETLMGNIRQIYNDEIQQRTSELEYNASIEETLANYLANKYAQDTEYATGINTNATSIYNNNQTSLASLINAAIGAEAQDNYSDAYKNAAQIQADAQVKAADIAAQAQLEAQRLALQAAQAQAAANVARSYSNGGGAKGNTTIKDVPTPKGGGNTGKVNPGTPYTPPYNTTKLAAGTTYQAYVKPLVQSGILKAPSATAGVSKTMSPTYFTGSSNTRTQSKRK